VVVKVEARVAVDVVVKAVDVAIKAGAVDVKVDREVLPRFTGLMFLHTHLTS
jgi:hypothetical protein